MSPRFQKVTYGVTGLHCASCAAMIQKKLAKVPGLASLEINIGTNTVELEFDSGKTSVMVLNKIIVPLGYEFVPLKTAESDQAEHVKRLRTQTNLLFPLALIYFAAMIYHALGMIWRWPMLPISAETMNIINLLIASVVQFGFGQKYLKSLWRFVRHGEADMDALVGMGTLTAYVYSAVLTIFPGWQNYLNVQNGQLYFEAVIVVIGFITFGDYLVAKSKLKTGEALEKLVGLQVKMATVWREKKGGSGAD